MPSLAQIARDKVTEARQKFDACDAEFESVLKQVTAAAECGEFSVLLAPGIKAEGLLRERLIRNGFGYYHIEGSEEYSVSW